MFGGGGSEPHSLNHFRGDSTQASSLHYNVAATTQPTTISGKENKILNREDVNESNFFYNSDEDREVDEIL